MGGCLAASGTAGARGITSLLYRSRGWSPIQGKTEREGLEEKKACDDDEIVVVLTSFFFFGILFPRPADLGV